MSNHDDISGFRYDSARLSHAHEYLLPTIDQVLCNYFATRDARRQIFDLGCGNGSVANWLTNRGYDVTGVDPSKEGIATASAAYPGLNLHYGADDALAEQYGTFPAVISLEVIEHVYAPRAFVRSMHKLVGNGGIAIVSTPYHGYVKNAAIVLSGNFDRHFSPLWDHGHIKFWSKSTFFALLTEAGFHDIAFHRVGRIPMLAKSIIAVARKPLKNVRDA